MRLIGRYLDREIIFDLVEEKAGVWTFKTQIPAVSSGYIILELYAIDEAGNVGTARETILLIDFNNLTIEVFWSSLSAGQLESGITAKAFDDGPVADTRESNYSTVHFSTDYGVVVLNDIR